MNKPTLINDLPHGFRTTIIRDVQDAISLLNILQVIEDSDVRSGVLKEALNKLWFSCNILSKALRDETVKEIRPHGLFPSLISLKNLASHTEKDSVFIMGAVSDPFIHGTDNELRDGAITNLYKAMIMLEQRIQPYN